MNVRGILASLRRAGLADAGDRPAAATPEAGGARAESKNHASSGYSKGAAAACVAASRAAAATAPEDILGASPKGEGAEGRNPAADRRLRSGASITRSSSRSATVSAFRGSQSMPRTIRFVRRAHAGEPPVVTQRTGRRVEQGPVGYPRALRCRLGEIRANGGRVTQPVLVGVAISPPWLVALTSFGGFV